MFVNPYLPIGLPTSYMKGQSLLKESNLAERAKQLGYPCIGICNENTLGNPEIFYETCIKNGIKPLIGCSLRISHPIIHDKKVLFQLNSLTPKGWVNLNKLLSLKNLQKNITWDIFLSLSEDLLVLDIGKDTLISFEHFKDSNHKKTIVDIIENSFQDRFFIGLQTYNQENEFRYQFAKEFKIPAVISTSVFYENPNDYYPFDILKSQSRSHTEKWSDVFGKGYSFVQASQRVETYLNTCQDWLNKDDLLELKNNARDYVKRSWYRPVKGFNHIPTYKPSNNFYVSDDLLGSSSSFLKSLVLVGLGKKFAGDLPQIAIDRIDEEMQIIDKLGFSDYFLHIWELFQFCRQENIRIGSKGSIGGSLVAYGLGLSFVDPLVHGLPFFRFLSIERKELPDIDLDVDITRVNDIVRYLTSKFGEDHVATIQVIQRLTPKNAFEIISNQLRIPPSQAEMVKDSLQNYRSLSDLINDQQLMSSISQNVKLVQSLKVSERLEGLFQRINSHPNGLIISKLPIKSFHVIEKNSGNGAFASIKYRFCGDMKTVNATNLIKLDLIGLNIYSLFSSIINKIELSGQRPDDISEFNYHSNELYNYLNSTNFYNLFQFNSEYGKKLLREFEPQTFDELIALISLMRPGANIFIPYYKERKEGKQKPRKLSPEIDAILENTYGLPLFQEQLMEIAMAYAGFNLHDADQFRRAISKQNKDLLSSYREKFIVGANQLGHHQEEAKKVFDHFANHAKYTFNKSHAVAYAILILYYVYLHINYKGIVISEEINLYENKGLSYDEILDKYQFNGIDILPPTLFSSNRDTEYSVGTIKLGYRSIPGISENQIAFFERFKELKINQLEDLLNYIDLEIFTPEILDYLYKIKFFKEITGVNDSEINDGNFYGYLISNSPNTFNEVYEEILLEPEYFDIKNLPAEPIIPKYLEKDIEEELFDEHDG